MTYAVLFEYERNLSLVEIPDELLQKVSESAKTLFNTEESAVQIRVLNIAAMKRCETWQGSALPTSDE